MKYLGVAGVLLGLSLLGVPALADEAKQPVPRVGQVVIESMGPASGTIPKGKLATIVNYIHADKHTWYKNGSRHTAKYPFNKGTQRNLHDRFVLKMRYGLGDGYDVRFATPIVMNNFRAHSTLTPNSVSSKNGIGDTTFVLHKQFLSQREGSPVDMAWDLGVWTPTGGTSDDGVGTGAWGAMAGLGVGHAFDGGRQFVEGEVMYLYRGVGHTSRVDVSDVFRLNGRYVYALSQHWDMGVETQFEYNTDSRRYGRSNNDASTTWFAGPSVTLKLPEYNASLGVSAQFSLYQNYDAVARIGRMSFQELFSVDDMEHAEGWRKLLCNVYFSTFITLVFGFILTKIGYANIWPLFGSANQLLSALVLSTLCVFLKVTGRSNKMLFPPLVIMLCVTFTALVQRLMAMVKAISNAASVTIPAGETTWGAVFIANGLQLILAVLLIVLGLNIVFHSFSAYKKAEHNSEAKA